MVIIMEEMKNRYEKELRKPNIFFENAKEGVVAFYNNDGHGIGFVDGKTIYNTSFSVGRASYSDEEGGLLWYGRKEISKKVGFVTPEGDVYYSKEGIPTGVFDKGIIKSKKKAEAMKIGRVEVNGRAADAVGIAYDLSGAKVGEVQNAGELAILYGGAMLAFVINHDEKNAPYSHSYKGFFTPAPPSAAADPRRDMPPVHAAAKPPKGLKKLFKFIVS